MEICRLKMKVSNRILIIAIIVCISCNLFSNEIDPDFKDDITKGKSEFIFDINKLPQLDQTSEKDLKNLYSVEPNRRLTFKKSIPKEILKRTVKVDKIIEYIQYKNKTINEPGVTGYIGTERIYFRIFLEKGIVKQYIIKHIISKGDAWVKGKYDNTPSNQRELESWPDSDIDMDCYWIQRKDRNYKFGNTSNWKCPYWEAVPAWEKK